MAGALGFEPRMQVPKTRALPLGYAPIINSYNTKKRIYIVFEDIHQYFLYSFLNSIIDLLQSFLVKKYATIADPEPVILTKSGFDKLSKNDFIFFNFGYLDNAIGSSELCILVKNL